MTDSTTPATALREDLSCARCGHDPHPMNVCWVIVAADDGPDYCSCSIDHEALAAAYQRSVVAERVRPSRLPDPELRCTQCGSADIHTRWDRDKWDCTWSRRRDPGNLADEHLHRFCRNCAHGWADAAPAPEAATPTAEHADLQRMAAAAERERIARLREALRRLADAADAHSWRTGTHGSFDGIDGEVARARAILAELRREGPEIIVLCGSTRFYDMFQAANYDLTMMGKIVLSVGFYPHSKAIHGHGEGVGHDSAEKGALDELHKRKIDLADRVYVLNVGGYIGESTRGEIEYARALGRPIDYLETPREETP